MLIKLAEYIKPTNVLKRHYKGVVKDNLDPKKLGRLKIEIKGLFEGDKESLPFCFPKVSDFLGGSTLSGSVSIPNIDAELEIVFPFNDIYSPYYVGYWRSNKTKLTLFEEDYPNSYGFQDEVGNIFKINKLKKTLDIIHSSGTKISIIEDGSLTFEGVKLIEIKSTDNTLIDSQKKVDIKSKEDMTIDSLKKLIIKATTAIEVTSPKVTFNNPTPVALDGYTTAKGHQGVIDLISGAPVVADPKTFGSP